MPLLPLNISSKEPVNTSSKESVNCLARSKTAELVSDARLAMDSLSTFFGNLSSTVFNSVFTLALNSSLVVPGLAASNSSSFTTNTAMPTPAMAAPGSDVNAIAAPAAMAPAAAFSTTSGSFARSVSLLTKSSFAFAAPPLFLNDTVSSMSLNAFFSAVISFATASNISSLLTSPSSPSEDPARVAVRLARTPTRPPRPLASLTTAGRLALVLALALATVGIVGIDIITATAISQRARTERHASSIGAPIDRFAIRFPRAFALRSPRLASPTDPTHARASDQSVRSLARSSPPSSSSAARVARRSIARASTNPSARRPPAASTSIERRDGIVTIRSSVGHFQSCVLITSTY